jgi:hypothetical protein
MQVVLEALIAELIVCEFCVHSYKTLTEIKKDYYRHQQNVAQNDSAIEDKDGNDDDGDDNVSAALKCSKLHNERQLIHMKSVTKHASAIKGN